MKLFKRILYGLAIAALLIVAVPTTAEAKNYEVYAGKKVTVSIPVTKGVGGDGKIVFSNPSIIASYTIKGNNLGTFDENNGVFAFAGSETITNGSIQITIEIAKTAKAGDTCVISVADYEMTNEDFEMEPSTLPSQTITVKEKTTTPVTPKPEEPVDKTDYTELRKQIEIAESLKSTGYTKESWQVLSDALAAAKAANGAKDQAKADAAAAGLKSAIAGLTRVNYSDLQTAISSAENLIAIDDLGQLWKKLSDALTNALSLLNSDDQTAVNKATEELTSLMEQIRAAIERQEEEKEDRPSDVVTEPQGDYCNVFLHKVWPILFLVSLAGNAVLLILVVDKYKRKEKLVDDMPVIDYEISDDDQ